jgi:hypothetical protein
LEEICEDIKFYKEYLVGLIMGKDFTFGEVFGNSWNLFKSKFGLLASLAFIFYFLPTVIYGFWTKSRAGLLGGLATPTVGEFFRELFVVLPGGIVVGILSLVASLSIIYFLNNKPKKGGLTFGESLKGGLSFLIAGILVTLLVFIFLIPLFLLLIIPGIIFGVYWAFSLYALVVDKTTIRGALKKSHDVVRGKWWRVVGYMILLGLILMVVSWVGAALGLLGSVGYVLQVVVSTLITIFSTVFMNTFYLALRNSK